MTVRPATTDDIPAIAALLSELRGEKVAINAITDSLARITASDQRDVLLVCDQAMPLGMAVITLVHKLPVREARIDEVVVSAAARGRGFGGELIHGCETWAREHNADVIEFTSRPSRAAANHLYQKLGYHIRPTNVYHKSHEEFSI